MKRRAFLIFLLGFYSQFLSLYATESPQYFVGSSVFMLGNLFPDPPSYYQVDFGYRPTGRDAVILEFITWKYGAPLGIPYWGAFGDTSENYPGTIRSYGLGVDYQRFLWKGAYAKLQVINFRLAYHDAIAQKEYSGYQLFLRGSAGYRFEFYQNHIYLEPSVVCNWWPIQTGMPKSFQIKEDQWPNYFFAEPGLNLGVQF